MPGSWEGHYIRLERGSHHLRMRFVPYPRPTTVIRINNLPLPSERIPAGFYVSINVDSRRRWKSAIRVVSSDKSGVLDDIVILSLLEVLELSLEIRVSYELGRMLGNGEVVGKVKTSWDELLDHGNEPFDISFPPVCGDHSSLTLKAAVLHPCDNQDSALLDSIVECELSRNTDAGHEQFATYVTSKTVSHLNDAVQHFQLVLDQCLIGHPDQAAALTNLAWARLKGYIHEDFQDIESITSLFREALVLRPQGHPDHPLSIYHLTKALIWRYGKDNTAVYIHEYVQLFCKLLALCPEGTYLRSIMHNVDRVVRLCNGFPIDASDEGIRLRRNVLELCPLGNEHRPEALHKLAWVLMVRFQQRGTIDDLDECIERGHEAVSLCSEEHSRHDFYLNNLAVSLYHRFNHQGHSNDLNQAIYLYEEVLRLHPVGHNHRDRTINLQREALTLCPPGNPNRNYTLNNLASTLRTIYNELDANEYLNEAIDLSGLRSRFNQTGKNEDIEEAIRLCQKSLVVLPSLHPDRYFSYMVLKNAYVARYRIQNNPADLSLAVDNFRLGARHPTQGFPHRIAIALCWVDAAENSQHDSTLEAYQICLELFDNHMMTRSSVISRREAATTFCGAQSLPVDAASCAIRRDDLRRAVELLEQGRGLQWSLASRLRTPLEDLKLASPELALRLSEINEHLSDAQGSVGSADRAAADRAAVQYRRLQEEWGAAVAEIRDLQDFSRFLLPPSYEDLQAAARHGPVIILIASQYSCSAIIVPTSGEPHHISFPRITLTHLEKLKNDFARKIRIASCMRPEETRKELQVLLQTVWDDIMLLIVIVLQRDLKVRAALESGCVQLEPSLLFLSTQLTPFERRQTDVGGNYAWKTSTSMMKTSVTPSFAVIGQSEPGAGQGKALVTIDSELELVRKLVPTTANPITVSGDDATRAGVLDALQRNTWIHLACHGKQDCEQPYYSRFAMRDKPLTLLDIMERDIPHAEFAFLSACHTAVGDEKTPDEVIHLAAGLQFSGFKSVIGTLWVVDDAVAKHVVEAFYEKMFKDGVMDCTKAAWALNRATNAVRKKVPLEQRIVFIHIGV
ncbi:CHAT domain-containing protein [Suillus subalutaceus]|uniref:CHAT domain-containing protein n=1 Tax=Suillus subalutaceus TaxID=48586 RepID=UPI001B86E43D|nr:CHAT domain-containing protein [Suillus subalutaceus]KAG1862770.1 CHAT domain-containing protein [Suillus subalutaceus]